MPDPRFLSLDQVDASTHHGVKVATLGEDGDMGEVAFTHDRRRAIAATVALHRREYRAHITEVVVVGAPRWWRVVATCGCGPVCECPLDTEGDPVHRCQHYGLPPCLPDTFAWVGLVCTADDPGALPVTELEVVE